MSMALQEHAHVLRMCSAKCDCVTLRSLDSLNILQIRYHTLWVCCHVIIDMDPCLRPVLLQQDGLEETRDWESSSPRVYGSVFNKI